MTFPSDLKSYCDTTEPLFVFHIDELKALYSVLEHEYIPYENVEAHNVVRKIFRLVSEHELAQANNGTA